MCLEVAALSEIQQEMLPVLEEFGLCRALETTRDAGAGGAVDDGGEPNFYLPTLMTQQLCNRVSSTGQNEEGYVVVESNFKVFLKSSSNLKNAIVSLFARIEASLPGTPHPDPILNIESRILRPYS